MASIATSIASSRSSSATWVPSLLLKGSSSFEEVSFASRSSSCSTIGKIGSFRAPILEGGLTSRGEFEDPAFAGVDAESDSIAGWFGSSRVSCF